MLARSRRGVVLACSGLADSPTGALAIVREPYRDRRYSDMGSVDHRCCRRAKSHPDLLVRRHSRPVLAAQAAVARAEGGLCRRQSVSGPTDKPN